ncbi:hypothetical protein [Erythrobacter sp.]|uniref:hypothetical protein n=1 Tax=Erythrobacter sp. TaxID=1042 RepID=UPI0025F7F5FC|nr:hypothetical protein [Erythrobacter sp.]
MDTANHQQEFAAQEHGHRLALAPAHSRSGLRLVSTGLRLAEPVLAPDAAWADAFAQLTGWLDIAVEPVAANRTPGLQKVAAWARSAAGTVAAPQFAPWQPISPVALQNADNPDLPRADWAASYLFDHGQGSGQRVGALDLMLMSPHPARCEPGEDRAAPLPRLGIVEAMLRAARKEGRSRIAIIVPASQRNAAIKQLLMAGRSLTRDGVELEILAVEQALAGLLLPRPQWDALIVTPCLRSIVFAMLAQATGVAGPWPMLWHGARGLVLVASEVLSDARGRLPLDAAVMTQALALTMQHAGKTSAALRLHRASAQLRDSGVVTPSRGSPAPYVTEIDDAQFVQLVCSGSAASKRVVPHWRAMPESPPTVPTGDAARLTLVAANLSPSAF